MASDKPSLIGRGAPASCAACGLGLCSCPCPGCERARRGEPVAPLVTDHADLRRAGRAIRRLLDHFLLDFRERRAARALRALLGDP